LIKSTAFLISFRKEKYEKYKTTLKLNMKTVLERGAVIKDVSFFMTQPENK
jgi:hypothetical protein